MKPAHRLLRSFCVRQSLAAVLLLTTTSLAAQPFELELASRALDNTERTGDLGAVDPVLPRQGLPPEVFFRSRANNLLLRPPTHARDQVYRYVPSSNHIGLVSRQLNGVESADQPAFPLAVSDDGRMIIFRSKARNLVSAQTFGFGDVYLATITTTQQLLSKTPTGTGGNHISGLNVDISADGRSVVFDSQASNLTLDANRNGPGPNGSDIYQYSLNLDSPALISRSIHGGTGNGPSERPRISADGRYIVFESKATDLTEDTDSDAASSGDFNIYLYDSHTDEISLVSRAVTGGTGNGKSIEPVIDATGSVVVFLSEAQNLTDDATLNGSGTDVFLYDRQADEVILVSRSTAGSSGNSSSEQAVVSPDGGYVSFTSRASNLIADGSTDHNRSKVFLYERSSATLVLASRAADGGSGNGDACCSQVADEGRVVSFLSLATNMTGDVDHNGPGADLFVYERESEALTLLSTSVGGGTGNGAVQQASLTDDGRSVAFSSLATDHTHAIDNNNAPDVFVSSRGPIPPQRDVLEIPVLGMLGRGVLTMLLLLAAFRGIKLHQAG